MQLVLYSQNLLLSFLLQLPLDRNNMYKDLIQKSKLNFYVLAYLFIIAFTIWVSNSADAFYRKYIETINTPETLMFLYIYRGDNVEFIWKLFLLFLFDGFIVFYLIRKISINQFYEYILNFIVLFISINLADIYTPHKLYSFLQNSFLFPVYALFILIFNSDYAVQNYSFWGCWIILLLPFYKKIHKRQPISKNNKIIISLLLLFNLIIFYAIFPQFLVNLP